VDGTDLVLLINNPGQIELSVFNTQFGQSSPTSSSGLYGFYYFYDGNGNVGQLVDDGANIASHYEYDPFGNNIMSSDNMAVGNPYGFSTKYFDNEYDLYYYGYRYYLPELGRWMNSDPIGENGGINLYEFVLNNPANQVDPFGFNISKSGIENHRYVFTCKCGWLDFVHIKQYFDHYMKIMDAISQGKTVIRMGGIVPKDPEASAKLYEDYPIPPNIETDSGQFKWIMEPLIMIGKKEEQATLDSNKRYWGIVKISDISGFSYEDLPNDYYGILLGKYGHENGIEFDVALKRFINYCDPLEGVPDSLYLFDLNEEAMKKRTPNKSIRQEGLTDCGKCKGEFNPNFHQDLNPSIK
jgi:RHS repeat-associated protein